MSAGRERSAFLSVLHRELFKPAGFRKQAANLRRTHGGTRQLVNFQGAAGEPGTALAYVNVAVGFEEFARHWDRELTDRLREYEFDKLGFRTRLEALVGGPDVYDLASVSDQATLRETVAEVLAGLAMIDSLEAFATHPYRERVGGWEVRMLTPYCLGQDAEARAVVDELVKRFGDRGFDADQLIERHRLDRLREG